MSSYKAGSTYPSRLLAKASGRFEKDVLATTLGVSVPTLDGYLACEVPIPVDQQLRLADAVITKVPSLARMGYQLREQIRAKLLYESRDTTTHMSAPVRPFK